MTNRSYLYQLLVLSSITICSMVVTTKAGQPSDKSPYPKIKLNISPEEQTAIEASLLSYEQERAKREKLLKQEGQGGLNLNNRTIPTPSAPPAPATSATHVATTPPPPSYAAAMAGQPPLSKAQPYPTSSAQPTSQERLANPTPPAGAAAAEPQYQPYRPVASAAAAAAPRSYSQQVLHAAWAKTQSWGTYFSERARAGWASFKAWLDSLLR